MATIVIAITAFVAIHTACMIESKHEFLQAQKVKCWSYSYIIKGAAHNGCGPLCFLQWIHKKGATEEIGVKTYPLFLVCEDDAASMVSARKRFENLTVLISEWGAAQSQHIVDNRTHVTRKQPSHVKKTAKGSDFSKFYIYFCHVIDDFCLFFLQH